MDAPPAPASKKQSIRCAVFCGCQSAASWLAINDELAPHTADSADREPERLSGPRSGSAAKSCPQLAGGSCSGNKSNWLALAAGRSFVSQPAVTKPTHHVNLNRALTATSLW